MTPKKHFLLGLIFICLFEIGCPREEKKSNPSSPVCGNGAVENGEECDDGNTTDGDGCNSVCKNEPSPDLPQPPLQPSPTAECGNGTIETGEECDDRNIRKGDGCSDLCKNQEIEPSPIPWAISLHPEDVREYTADPSNSATTDWNKPSLDEAIQKIKELGAEMVRFDIPWDDIQPVRGAINANNWCYTFSNRVIECKTAGLNFFRDTFLPALKRNYLTPIVVLARPAKWAIEQYYNAGNKDLFWQEWQRYCGKVAYHLGNEIYYYQLWNEANLRILAWVDPIDPQDDPKLFSECHAGITSYDASHETIVNAHVDGTNWEGELKTWLDDANAGPIIDIIAIDNYPGSHYADPGPDKSWDSLDRLFYYMDTYDKKGAIAETGFTSSVYNPFTWGATDTDQQNWIKITLPIIKEKVKNRSDVVFANFYELLDSGGLNPEGHYGVLISINNKKSGFDDLKNQIKGTAARVRSLSVSALSVSSCPDYGDQADADSDGLENACDDDMDSDGIPNDTDNCPLVSNPDQKDTDGDGHGDVCDQGLDPDDLIDTDGDIIGNNADTDDDGDGYSDVVEINLGSDSLDPNSRPADNDKDGIPDILDPDDDNDGVPDNIDVFPFDPAESRDSDNDGTGDNADLDDDNDGVLDTVEISLGTDPANPFSTPDDFDGDGIPDALDPDDDGDGIFDESDVFQFDASEWRDNDSDRLGDNRDMDDDNDLYTDVTEKELGTDSLNSGSKPSDNDLDLIPDVTDPDDDNDRVMDENDAFQFDPAEWLDTDGDKIGNNADQDDDDDKYPDDMEKSLGSDPLDANSRPADFDNDLNPDALDLDDDNDGYPDNIEEREGSDPFNKDSIPLDCDHDLIPNTDDTDDDNDNVPDTEDACSCDPTEWSDYDHDGICENTDTDDDNDCYSDVVEVTEASNPLDASSIPADNDRDCNPNSTDPQVSIITNKDYYVLGETVEAVIRANNPYEISINLGWPTTCQTRIVIDNVIMGCDGDNPAFTSLSIEPNRYHDWPWSLEYADYPMELGSHKIGGIVEGFGDRKRETGEKLINVEGDNDRDGIPDTPDLDDDNDCYADIIEISEGSDRLSANSVPADFDRDCNPDSTDADDDNDTHPDVSDAFPKDPTEWADNDRDRLGDNADPDDDNDGYTDIAEKTCGSDPLNPSSRPPDYDGDKNPDCLDPDDDNDGVNDASDNCQFIYNVNQANNDNDSLGDICDADDDNDGVLDNVPDNCPLVSNADQLNNDGDAQGDVCDGDDDNDSVSDTSDNCQFISNANQANNDGDAQGDVCDADDDNDGVNDTSDNCQFIYNVNQANNDGDAHGDVCDGDDDNDGVADSSDNCPLISNSNQANCEGDTLGDACDSDDDNDNVGDSSDAFPCNASEWADNDKDGTGNNADTDDDNDGMSDLTELKYGTNPNVANPLFEAVASVSETGDHGNSARCGARLFGDFGGPCTEEHYADKEYFTIGFTQTVTIDAGAGGEWGEGHAVRRGDNSTVWEVGFTGASEHNLYDVELQPGTYYAWVDIVDSPTYAAYGHTIVKYYGK